MPRALERVAWLVQTTADVPPEDAWLSAWEQARLSSFQFPKRRDDWRLGRWTAKRAIQLSMADEGFDGAQIEIRSDEDGSPRPWVSGAPAPIALSLSHRGGRSLCVVGPSELALGCDLELVERREPVFVLDYFVDEEQQQVVAEALQTSRDVMVTAIWSAKESSLKAMRTGLRSSTHDVVVRLHAKVTSHEWVALTVALARTGTTFRGWCRLDDSWVMAVVGDRAFEAPALVRSGG